MNFASELETLIRARYPILYIISNEEMRVQQLVLEIARKRQKKVFEWSCSMGMVPAGLRWLWKGAARQEHPPPRALRLAMNPMHQQEDEAASSSDPVTVRAR